MMVAPERSHLLLHQRARKIVRVMLCTVWTEDTMSMPFFLRIQNMPESERRRWAEGVSVPYSEELWDEVVMMVGEAQFAVYAHERRARGLRVIQGAPTPPVDPEGGPKAA